MNKYRTLLDEARLFNIRRAVDSVKNVQGRFAELGVYRGGVARMLTEIAPARRLDLFDTFTGMPPITTEGVDEHKSGDFGDTNLREVQSYVNNPNAFYFEGIFKGAPLLEELQDCEAAVRAGEPYESGRYKYAFVHLDADLYESTEAGLNYFWPRLEHGGILILDDYFWPNCPGVLKAVAEYFQGRLKEAYFSMDAPYQLEVKKL